MVIAILGKADYYQNHENGNKMQNLDHSYRVLYSELAQRTLDAQFTTEFSLEGRFITQEVSGRRYWYFDTAKPEGGKTRRYVGPVDDEEITSRVERFKDLKADHKMRRKLVSTLVREAYLPQPDRLAGDVIQALAEAGFFRLRGVLVGTTAFHAYSALLGVRLNQASMVTADADFAQFHSISVAVEDAIPPVLDVLRDVDDTFREVPHQADGRRSTQFRTRSGYKVEFLTPNTGSTDYDGRPAPMPALGGSAAEPLRFLDFLIYEPKRAVLLHGAGVSVLVPAPERYAVHKLIVASRRRQDGDRAAKADKDRAQALALMTALVETRHTPELVDAWIEARDRGAAWREAIDSSIETFLRQEWEPIRAALAETVKRSGADAGRYGLADAEDNA